MLKEPPTEDFKKLAKISQIIIGRIISASKNLKLYPSSSHPIIKRLISDSYVKLKEALGESEYFSLSIAGNVLLINDKPTKAINKQTVDKFLTALGRRKIGKITFIKGVDMDEFYNLLEILSLEPEDIEKMGGLRAVVTQKNISHITISGISFGETDDRKEAGIKWKDLLSLIAGSDDFIQKVENDPDEFSRVIKQSLTGEEGSPAWGDKVREAVSNITERLFKRYGKTDIETYTEIVSKIVLVLSPDMQTEMLFSKPDIPHWDKVVNNVIDDITANELGDLVAKETKKIYETIVMAGGGPMGAGKGFGDEGTGGVGTGGVGTGGTGTGGVGTGGVEPGGIGTGGVGTGGVGTGGIGAGGIGTGGSGIQGEGRGGKGTGEDGVEGGGMRGRGFGQRKLSNIDHFLANFVDKSKRKEELMPAIMTSLKKEGVNESSLEYTSGGRTRKEILEVIENDLMRTNIDTESLLRIKTLINKNADIEEILKSLIILLNNKNVETRLNVVRSFLDLTEKLLLLVRMDLIKLIIVAFSDRLGKEADETVFEAIVDAFSIIAKRLIKEGKPLLAEMIDDVLNNYLKTLVNADKLKSVIGSLSKIGDEKALKGLIYSINRDVAYKLINTELSKKGADIFSPLLYALRTIEDRITRLRVLSLLIDTAKNVPNFEEYLKVYIDDPRWYVRRNLSIILGEIGNEKALVLLARLVKDKEAKVRVEVMESLSKIKTEDSELHLIEGLKDPDKKVVKRALTSLRKLGTEMSIFALKALLEKHSFIKSDEVLEIQERVISVLCTIGGDEVTDILRQLIFDKSIFGKYKYNNKIRLLSVDGLSKIDTKTSKQVLTRVSWLKNQEVGKRAAEILKKATFL